MIITTEKWEARYDREDGEIVITATHGYGGGDPLEFVVGDMTQADVLSFVLDADIAVCEDCGDVMTTDGSQGYTVRESDGAHFCESCVSNSYSYASTVWLYAPREGASQVTVTDIETINQWGDPVRGIERHYVSTDAWRGYHETRLEGYTEITSGWTTGNWGDGISDRKQSFNKWANRVIEGIEECPFRIALVFDPTSNVFSTAVGVWVDSQQMEDFAQWWATTGLDAALA